MKLPYWARLALAGAVFAVAADYFLRPTIGKTLGVKP